MGCADQIRKNRPTLTRTRPTIAPDALCSSLRIFSKKYRASCSSVDVFDSHHQRTVCRDTPSGRPPGLLGHWTSRLQDYVSTSYLYSHLRAKCCQISVEYRSGRQDLNLRTLLPHRDRTMDADDVFDRVPGTFVPYGRRGYDPSADQKDAGHNTAYSWPRHRGRKWSRPPIRKQADPWRWTSLRSAS